MRIQNTRGIGLISLLALLLFLCIVSVHGQTSENYLIKTSSISSGASPLQTAASYKASSTAGQNISSPELEGTQFFMTSGFNGILRGVTTEVSQPEEVVLPKVYRLFQNYPNPFNPETIIRYQLPKTSQVILTIHNVLGQQVKMLVDQEQQAGEYTMTWDGSNDLGLKVVSGLYFFRLKAGEFVKTRKMVFVR